MARKVFLKSFKPRRIISKELDKLKEDVVEQIGASAAKKCFNNVRFNFAVSTN